MANVLAQLEVVSAGTIAGYSPVPKGGAHESSPPRSGDAWPPHERFAARYNDCSTDSERDRVIAAAEKELRNLRRSRPPAKTETKKERDGRIVIEGEGFSALEVAMKFRCGVRDVWSARHAAARDKDYGRPLGVTVGSVIERRQRVAEMKARGMTERQIALALGVSRPTVSKDLRRVA
jgi:hypothetical protein